MKIRKNLWFRITLLLSLILMLTPLVEQWRRRSILVGKWRCDSMRSPVDTTYQWDGSKLSHDRPARSIADAAPSGKGYLAGRYRIKGLFYLEKEEKYDYTMSGSAKYEKYGKELYCLSRLWVSWDGQSFTVRPLIIRNQPVSADKQERFTQTYVRIK